MTYEVFWHTPKHIMTVRMKGDITLEEVREIHAIVTQLGQESRQMVHLMIDMRDVTSFPTSLMRLSRALGMVDNRRFGWLLIISDDPVLRFLMTTLGKLIKARFRVFGEGENALDFLAIADSRVDSLTIRYA